MRMGTRDQGSPRRRTMVKCCLDASVGCVDLSLLTVILFDFIHIK
jgi:hypothetical protein